jgi:hypothetical protein
MGSLKFGAFPRSGSHFFLHLTNCEWLDHRIEPLGTEQNVVVSIRNPLECVPSWIVLTEDSRIDRAEKVLDWYCAYYSKCSISDLVVIPFEQLISEPVQCVDYVAQHYGLTIKTNPFNLSDGIHYPSKNKNNFATIIEEMRTSPSFQPAMGLFEELCVPVG